MIYENKKIIIIIINKIKKIRIINQDTYYRRFCTKLLVLVKRG